MFTEQEKSIEFRLKHGEKSSYEQRLKSELVLNFANRPQQTNFACDAPDFYYNPRDSEAIYEIPALEQDKKIECFAKLRCRKSNTKPKNKMTSKLFIFQIIVVLTCLSVSCINVYFLMQFKFKAHLLQQNPSIAKTQARVKELEEHGKTLKEYVKQMESNTKILMDMVEPLQAFVCFNFNISRAERKVLGCVTGVYK